MVAACHLPRGRPDRQPLRRWRTQWWLQPPITDQNFQCSRVAEAVGASKVVYPNDEAYRRSIASYWGPRPREVQPGCVVLAQSSQDVATAIATVTNSRTRAGFCLFAVRSGGHNPWPDHANIGGGQGVTIDLTAMNSVSLSQNGTIASVGPGARWGDVYEILGRQGRAIVGGRDGRVGVGGLTTGGNFPSPNESPPRAHVGC